MKKWMTLLLCCVLALNLTACGAGAPGGPEDNAPPQASALHFEVATQIYENEYKADDGTVLLAERYELPVLELRTEDGKLYTLAENVTANGGTGNPAQVTAQNAFNTEMNNVLAGLESEAAQMAAEAKELYAENGTSVFLNGSYWTNELSLTQTYMTEGKFLSIAAENYTYYGGVHPNSATRAWSFDLTTGEFLTLDALASEDCAVAAVEAAPICRETRCRRAFIGISTSRSRKRASAKDILTIMTLICRISPRSRR